MLMYLNYFSSIQQMLKQKTVLPSVNLIRGERGYGLRDLMLTAAMRDFFVRDGAGLTSLAYVQLDPGRPSGPPYLHSVYVTSNQDMASDLATGACLRTSQKWSNNIKASEDVAYMCQVLRPCCKLKVNNSCHARVS